MTLAGGQIGDAMTYGRPKSCGQEATAIAPRTLET